MPLWRNATRGRPINGVLLLVESFFFVQQVEKKVSLLVAPVKKSFMAGGSRLSLSLSLVGLDFLYIILSVSVSVSVEVNAKKVLWWFGKTRSLWSKARAKNTHMGI